MPLERFLGNPENAPMGIVAVELLVLPILDRPHYEWLADMQVRRQRAREEALRRGHTSSILDAHEEHAMLPPWLVNPVGFLVIGIDDGPHRPSFCGDIYVKRKLFPRSKAANVIAPERRHENAIAREHMLPWAETGRFDEVADVVGDCEERLRRLQLLRGKQIRRPLQDALVWRSPVLGMIDREALGKRFWLA